MRYSLALAIALLLGSSPALGDSELNLPTLIRNGAVRVEREDGSALIRYRDSESFIPASTLKVATAFCALEALGKEYRFETVFFADGSGSLFIQGSGDPSLVSETLDEIARQLAQSMRSIPSIVIDTSLFSDGIAIDGSERSINPYDAKNSAFVANFSSALVTHARNGTVASAEPQTPLTPLARQAGLALPKGKTDRVNLSSDWKVGVQYGGELLAAFLRKYGVSGSMQVRRGSIPTSAREIMRHRSPQNLQEISQAMLKYSTNFTANQVFLNLGLTRFGAPATVGKGQRAMQECLSDLVGWDDFHVEEGSGLSRKNRVTATQMTALLKTFERYKFLLPEQQGFFAKTGSLRGVNTLAGYFTLAHNAAPVRFVVLINSEVPHLYKFKVASALRDYLEDAGSSKNSKARP